MREARAPWAGGAIAMIDPVGDAGIGVYTHELANGLAANGIRVDVFTTRLPFARDLPGRRYRLFPLFGDASRPLARRVRDPIVARQDAPGAIPTAGCALDPYLDLLERRAVGATGLTERDVPPPAGPAHAPLGHTEDEDHLAALLAQAGYDIAWTQWPELGGGRAVFWDACKRHGISVVHTVHNVVPHERYPGDVADLRRVYAAADALIVHSHAAAAALAAVAPVSADRIVVSRHGLYSIYPRRRALRAHVRARLGLTDDARALLCFGGIRPYKNLDAVLDALAERGDSRLRLLIAGWEWGYGRQMDPLARTRAAVRARGLEETVTLLPGPFGIPHTAELFEAADAVLLPYIEGFGSGVLLLAMTFGKHVIVSPAGGMHEYLDAYPSHTKLSGASPADVGSGIDRFLHEHRTPRTSTGVSPFSWESIAGRLVPALAERLGAATHA